MVSSTFLACHLLWKSEKVYEKGVINLSHAKRPSISSFVFFFSFQLHIYNYLNGKKYFSSSQCRLSRKTLHIYLVPWYYRLKPPLQWCQHNIYRVVAMLAFACTTNYYEFKLPAYYFTFSPRYDVNELILVPYASYFLHCTCFIS